jgi:NDP-sugar pyrophosphorylase family protein
MKAMILAAGLGTRLRPLTDNIPKALVEINGRTLLEIAIERLKSFGVREFIVNVHHHAEKIVSLLQAKKNFGSRIEISREDDLLLDTGGGLKKAAWFFLEGNLEEPFVVHNVDVVSTIDLNKMLDAHGEKQALATLAVQHRPSSRQLLFGPDGFLSGRRKSGAPDEIVRPSPSLVPLGFSGIHVVSPQLLPLITESGVFSIIDTYLRLAAFREKISGFRADHYYWRDLGRLDDLRQAESDYRNKLIS